MIRVPERIPLFYIPIHMCTHHMDFQGIVLLTVLLPSSVYEAASPSTADLPSVDSMGHLRLRFPSTTAFTI